MNEWEKEVDKFIALAMEHYTADDFRYRLILSNTIENIKKSTNKYVIGEDEPLFGAQNEAGDISEDDYISLGKNELRDKQRKDIGL